ncbi:MAG: hypothetical protein RLY21_1772 [Planctomycetota bacterium]|jgi:hypothetical protein
MPEGDPSPPPLATNRPWLAVAGCLGGSVVTGFLAAFTVAVVALLVFFPQFVGLGKGQTQIAITNALGELRRAPALKVATREVAVVVDASKPTELTVYPWIVPIGEPTKVELGRTSTQIVVPGNKVQYIVPLDGFAKDQEPDVHEVKRPDGRVFVVVLPPPRVDESLVEVQSDPTKLSEAVNRDWIDHILRDDEARNAALASIRAAVLDAARAETPMVEVREKARATVAEMIRGLLPADFKDCDIEIRWTDDPVR